MILRTVFALLLVGATAAAAPIRVLILSGQNNHDWKTTTPALKKILTARGQFAVDVTERPDLCTAATFAKYDVILSNWNTFAKKTTVKDWPAATKVAFLQFIRDGHGFVGIHAGTSAFYDWPEFQQIAGATWGNRVTRHNAPHKFTVKPAAAHPVTTGLKPFTTTDELWLKPAVQPGATVLATADGEPVAVATAFGQGRGFTLLLGHNDKFIGIPGFGELLARGVEWAATGKVTKAGGTGAAVSVKAYRYGQDRAVLAQLEKMSPQELAALLVASDATTDCKKAVCDRLSLVGTAAEVPVVAKLIGDKELGLQARVALERIPGEESLAALRAALPDPGAVAALGARRDAKAVPALAKLLPNDVAATALGEVGNREALAALLKNGGPAAAVLSCAEKVGDAAVLANLCATREPAQIRRAAFIGRLKVLGAQGGQVLLDALAGRDVVLKEAAILALSESKNAALLGAAAKGLPQLPTGLQIQLLGAVAGSGDRAALPAVLQAARSADPAVRHAAVAALGAVGDASAVPVLVELLDQSRDSQGRKAIVAALGRLPGPGVEAALAQAGRPETIQALVTRGATGAVPALLILAEQGNAEAVVAVGKLGGAQDGVRLMAALGKAPDRQVVEVALAGIYRRAGDLTPVVAAAAKASGMPKASLMAVLGLVGKPEGLPALRAALKDSDVEVQRAAARALSNWPDAAPLEDLQVAAATATDEKVRALAQRGVEQMTVLTNLARGAKATNPDGLKPDGAGGGPQAAIDGNPNTYWDETDNQKLYQLRVRLKKPATVSRIRIMSFGQHEYAPKDFAVVCDGRVIKKVTNAQYQNKVLTVSLPATRCATVQLNITGYYPTSPGIRELEIFGTEN